MNSNYERPQEDMSEQALREILVREWEKHDMNIDLLKDVATALEAKTGNVTAVDVQAAWQICSDTPQLPRCACQPKGYL